MSLRILICGATGGLGSVLAARLASAGHRVRGTARNPGGQASVPMLPMDVGSDASVASAFDAFVAAEGGIDVVINCCNRMILGTVEETSMTEVEDVYAVNVLGMIRVCRTALPHLRASGGGTIINLSSLGGVLPVPVMSAYTSAKFALEAFSEALYQEVRGEGIDVVILQPVAMHMAREAGGAHLEMAAATAPGSRTHAIMAMMERDTQDSPLTPEMVSDQVERILASPRKKLRYPLSRARGISMIRRLAPQAVIDRMLEKILPAG